jgi:hypothetical protein
MGAFFDTPMALEWKPINDQGKKDKRRHRQPEISGFVLHFCASWFV